MSESTKNHLAAYEDTRPVPQVYAAINAVQAALAKEGISKDRKNTQQGYAFRGIDDCYAAVAPHLAAHGLCVLPRVINRDVVERETKNGGTLFYTTLLVEFDLVSVKDGTKHTVCMVGEAMDSGDKSSNKAQSAALKYAFLQVFCIPTEGDNDADQHTHEVAARKQKPITPPKATPTPTVHPEPRKDVILATADQIEKLSSFCVSPQGKMYVEKIVNTAKVAIMAQLTEEQAAKGIAWIESKLAAAAQAPATQTA